jgi:regulator of extracellular matrix RemA (YlzA/DUF370 family)
VKPLYIGNDIYIDSNTIFCIMSAWHPKAKKFIAQAKKENTILDFTAGNARQSVIILNTGSIIISTVLPNVLADSIKG